MAENQNQNQNNNEQQQNAQVENQQQPSKFKKAMGKVKKGLIVGGLIAGGAYLEHKTGIVGKAINKIKSRKEETVQQSFQVRHSQGQTFNKGGQR